MRPTFLLIGNLLEHQLCDCLYVEIKNFLFKIWGKSKKLPTHLRQLRSHPQNTPGGFLHCPVFSHSSSPASAGAIPTLSHSQCTASSHLWQDLLGPSAPTPVSQGRQRRVPRATSRRLLKITREDTPWPLGSLRHCTEPSRSGTVELVTPHCCKFMAGSALASCSLSARGDM